MLKEWCKWFQFKWIKYGVQDHTLSHKLVSLFDASTLGSIEFLYMICHPKSLRRDYLYTSENITVFNGCNLHAQHVPFYVVLGMMVDSHVSSTSRYHQLTVILDLILL